MTIIFNEEDRSKRARYKIKGCEKTIVVRGLVQPATLTLYTVSQLDPRFRQYQVIQVNSDMDICIEQYPCLSCGMDLIFELNIDTTGVNNNVFVEILDDTCVPEPCCDC